MTQTLLDSASGAFLEAMHAGGGQPLHELSVEDARAAVRGASQQLAPPSAEVERVEDRRISVAGEEIALRIYTPKRVGAGTAMPIVLHFHGGGWVAGDLDTHDSIARFYSANADAIVVAVDYRQPPERKFPAAVDDCYAAIEWAAAHTSELSGDRNRLAVAGDSAGGNLAAVVCQLAKARGGPAIAYQALIYPACDLRDPVDDPKYPSRREFGQGEYFLSLRDMTWFRGHYLGDLAREPHDPRVSPIAAADLRGLPAALVVTAGCDALRDEGQAYANRLSADGVPVEYRCFEGTIHAFMSFAGAIPLGNEALSFVASRLRAALS
jgi:acetyl esterase